MRTFISIDFPDEVVKEVARIQSILSKKKFVGKMTELENLHLTLKFLGEVDEEMINEVKKLLDKIDLKEMTLSLGSVGTFNYDSNPKIVWVKILGEEVWRLQKQIDSVLSALFKPEERFMSHLTISRIKHVKDKKEFLERVKSIHPKSMGFKINSFKLKLSELKPNGPVYTTLKEYPAKGV